MSDGREERQERRD